MSKEKIAIVTDAWEPQVNGVVRTLRHTRDGLRAMGCEVRVFSPQGRRAIPCPSYPEIPLALFPGRALARELDAFAPDFIHIATEGPLGWAARAYCRRRALAFTTSYHTRFPEYLRERLPVPVALGYALLRRFHGAARRTLVATPSLEESLAARGFAHLARWSRGVDTGLFHPRRRRDLGLPRPVFAYLGRVAVEKNVAAFLSLDLPGSKLVIGDGPALPELRRRHPEALFAGYRFGEDLAACLASADVFVFPSRTDTFGLVLLEAMASGLPVAAYPVTGPRDLVLPGVTGVLDEDLERAARAALHLDRAACRAHAQGYSWEAATRQFRGHLVPARAGRAVAVAPG